MGATLEETLAEIQAGQQPQSSPTARPQSPGSAAAPGSGGGGATAKAPSPEPAAAENSDGGFGSFMRGVGDTATFGFLDEAGGLVDSMGLTDGRENVFNSSHTFGDILAGNIAKNRAIEARDAEAHGGARLTGQLAGGFLIPISRIGSGVRGVATAGAVQGGLYGVGSGESEGGRALGGVAGAAGGFVLGGLLGKAAEYLGPKIAARFGKAPEEPSLGEGPGQEALATVHDEGVKPNQVPPQIVALTEEGEPVLASLPEGEHQAPLEATPPPKEGEAGGGGKPPDENAPTSPSEGSPSESTDLVRLALPPARIGAEGASEGAQQAGPEVGTIGREELEKMQGAINAEAPKINANERSADITWENSPDVAARVGEFRIGNIGGSAQARALIKGIAGTVEDKGVMTDYELARYAQAQADSVGADGEVMVNFAKALSDRVEDLPKLIATTRVQLKRLAEQVTDFHLLGIDWTTASDDVVQEAAQRIYGLSAMQAELAKVKTAMGRGFRVYQIPDMDAYLARLEAPDSPLPGETELRSASGQYPLPTTREELGAWFEQWGATGGDPSRQAAMVQGRFQLPTPGKYLRSSIANFFTANILSAPRTVLLNLTGPAVINTIRQIERHTGAGFASINPLLTSEQRAAARTVATTSAKAWLTTFGQMQDAFRIALVAAQRNKAVLGGGGQAIDTVGSYGPITKNLRLAQSTGTDSVAADVMYGLGNLINVWPRAFARVNNGLDEFAKQMAYQTEARTEALVAAATAGPNGEGLAGNELRQYVVNRMAQAYNPDGSASNAQLLRNAERSTLTMRVGEEGSKLRAVGNAIQRARNAVPELRFLLPVFNVAANGIAETMRRLPTAALPGILGKGMSRTADELAGVYGPIEQADAHGRMLMGASFLASGIMLARAGAITGAGPQDPTDRNVWLQTHQPYSFKIGGEWVRYDKYDIIGGLMAIPATIHDATIYNPEDQGSHEIIMSGVGALAQWFKDKAALRNATGILALGDDPTKSTANVFTRLGGNLASGLVIPAWMRTTITDTTSPELAMRNSWDDYVKAAAPYFANQMEPIRNVLGEPVVKPASSIGEALFPVTLVKAIGYDEDPVLDELDRLYQVTGYGAGADSSALSYGHFDPRTVKMEDGRSMDYHAMQDRQTLVLDGKTLRQSLDDLFKSEEYTSAVDGDSQAKTTSRGDASRGYLVSQVFKRYNAAIKQELAAHSPIAKDWLVAAMAKRRDDAYLRDTPTEDLVKNPDLYAAKGIDRGTLEAGLNPGTSSLFDALQGAQ